MHLAAVFIFMESNKKLRDIKLIKLSYVYICRTGVIKPTSQSFKYKIEMSWPLTELISNI